MASGTMLLYLFAMMMTITVVKCQCDDSNAAVDGSVDERKSIHDALESALISPRNLYLLRETFEPAFDRSPSVILIFYDVQLDNNETSRFEIGWSSYAFFSVIDPVSLSAFQSGMVMVFLTGLKILPLPQNITLMLDVHNSLPTCTLTASSIKLKSVLNTLTTRLKAYATAQGKLIQWDGSDKGFIWERPENNGTLVFLLIPITLITLVVLGVVIMFTPSVKKGLARASRNRVFGILFWSSSLTILMIAFGEVLLSVFVDFIERHHFHTFKLVMDLIPVGLGVLVGIGPSIWLSCSTPVPVPLFLLAKSKQYYSLALVMHYIFILLITVRALPTLLVALLYPLEVISAIVLITAYVVFFPLLLIPIFILLPCDITHSKKNGHIMCYSILSSLIAVFVLWVNILNMAVFSVCTNSTGFIQLLFSLTSSVVIAVCGYFMKRVFLGKKNIITLITEGNQDDNNTQEKDISMTPHNADPELQLLVVDGNMDTEP